MTFNIHELSTIEDFVISNGTRFGNFNSVKPLLQILFNLNGNEKIMVDISLKCNANIYEILTEHEKISLKQWVYKVYKKINQNQNQNH